MTAVVCIESDPDLSQVVTVDRADAVAASTTYLRAGYQVSVRDLLHLLLISSDNVAARTLARVSPWGPAGFVARMNDKATELGLDSTTYADPSGLDADNVSSAYDMARLIAYASADDRLSAIMKKPEYKLTLARRPVTIRSTNQLLSRTDMEGSVLGAKTGFISRSGYCLATLLKMPQVNQPVAVVVLGASSNAARFTEVRNLFTWLTTRAQDLVGKNEREPEGRRLAAVAPSRRRRVQRQRRHGIHRQHQRAPTLTGVVGLEIPAAHVARVEAVAAVGAGERRQRRAVVVQAERAPRVVERPPRGAAAADEAPFA